MSGPARVYKWPAFVGLLALAWLPSMARASAQSDFDAGIAAAQRQDHAAAINHFESAMQRGMRKPLLYYNLGVSYYRKGQLDKADLAFTEAAKSPQLAALSYYNLGLIARDRGERELAVNRFRQAQAAAQTEKMRNLSALAIEQMADEEPWPPRQTNPWFIWIEGALGYDSNAALVTDFENQTGGSDRTWGASAYGYYDFTHLRLHAIADLERYSELTDFNFDMLETGASLPMAGAKWELRPGLSGRHMRVGNEPLQDSAVLSLDSGAHAREFGLKFYLEYESISGAAGYEYLEGTRGYLQASVATPGRHWQLIWDVELNDRKDFTFEDGEFYSFSPRREQWRLEYSNPLTDRMELKIAAGLQDSEYSDPDIRRDEAGDISTIMRRKDERRRLVLELGYRHGEAWRSSLELMLIDRDSNFDEFDYDREVFTLNLGRSFGNPR